MVTSCVTTEQIISAFQRVPVERWGELLHVIESLQAHDPPSGTPAQPVRMGTDLTNSELIGIWADRTDMVDGHEFAKGLRRQAEQRDR